MQKLKKPEPNALEAATESDSPPLNSSTAGPKSQIQDFEAKADRWAQELIDNLNRNAKARVPTS